MTQTQIPLPNQLPFDVEDPILRAVAWSGIIEPGDPAPRNLIGLLGEANALAWVFSAHPQDPRALAATTDDSPDDQQTGEHFPWLKMHQRWHPRALELDLAEYLRMAQKLGARVLAPGGQEWPEKLSVLEDREPLALWILGDGPIEQLSSPSVALVGARASTSYGNRVAETFAFDLASAGYPIVSGGAYGIDSAAHRGALSAPSGSPNGVSVLCGGVGNLYPAGNQRLFDQLKHGGLIVSEVPPNWRPARWRFLERNRVIAALSDVVVVVEAGIRSGAIATANRALEIGRPVGAVPGPITAAASAGCHELIRDGADLVTNSEDVVRMLQGIPLGEPSEGDMAPFSLTPPAKVVWAAFPLSRRASAEDLAKSCGLTKEEVEVSLLELQLRQLATFNGKLWERGGLQ